MGILVTEDRREYWREYRRQHPKLYIKKGFNPNSIGKPFEKGHTPFFTSQRLDSIETKIKKSLSHLGELNSQDGTKGEESAAWKGGITP